MAVEKRLMGERRFGFMLSGGLESSLVAGLSFAFPPSINNFLSLTALATRRLLALGLSAPIAFSVGFEDSPDLENARKMAQFLGIPHRELVIRLAKKRAKSLQFFQSKRLHRCNPR